MRIVFVSVMTSVALLGGAAAGHASGNAPWCANITVGPGDLVEDCHYWSIEQCVPNVIAGNKGFCGQNPRWAGSYDPATGQPIYPAKQHRKHRVHRRY